MYQGDFSKWVDAKAAAAPDLRPVHHRGQSDRHRLHPRRRSPNNQIPQNRFSAFSKQIARLRHGRHAEPPGTRTGNYPRSAQQLHLDRRHHCRAPPTRAASRSTRRSASSTTCPSSTTTPIFDSGPGPSGLPVCRSRCGMARSRTSIRRRLPHELRLDHLAAPAQPLLHRRQQVHQEHLLAELRQELEETRSASRTPWIAT